VLILHIVPDLTRGGAEMMLYRLIREQAGNSGLTHRVVSLRSLGVLGEDIKALGVEVHCLGMRKNLRDLVRIVWALTHLMQEVKPDVIQTWLYHSDLLGGIAARRAGFGRRVVWGVRATHITPGHGTARTTVLVRRMCARLSRSLAERIVYVAHAARKVHEGIGYAADRGMVIPNGYVIPPSQCTNGRQSLRVALGLPMDRLLVGTAGRYNNLKDYPSFIAAAGVLAKSHQDVAFVMAGRDVNQSNAALIGLIAKTGHANRFHLLGERRDLQDILSVLDFFCLHSMSEGFPNVVAEAMAVGTPCVVTDVGDAAHIVAGTGIVVPISQPDRLAEAFRAMIDEGSSGRAARGAAARERVAAHFSIQAVASIYEELYAELAGQDGLVDT
jgi:glycosyltransferase involved in cell wall biosynthesis